jgi:hypothetical protein
VDDCDGEKWWGMMDRGRWLYHRLDAQLVLSSRELIDALQPTVEKLGVG